jgi:FkbM family methyltransferase
MLRNFMPFISYAQNYEDVILWRALRDLERGFYVDVGAADPEELSVTRAFYERGWSGINLEPLDEYFVKLALARPRDTNLKVAAGRETGQRTLHAVDGTGLSTMDPKIAAQHRVDGWHPREIVVPVVTLEKIFKEWAPPTIHFLKIDVEGAEAEVLEGLNLDLARPWIIVVEATKPFSRASTHAEWERLVTGHGYSFAYFDGLNRFYVADEFPQLKERLTVPPNIFDDFIRWPEWSNAHKAEGLEKLLEKTGTESKYLRTGLEAEKKYAGYLHDTLQAHRDQIATLHHLLLREQAQVASLTNALQAQQAQVAKLEVQLALPSVDRALGRAARWLHEKGDRFTGGGIRALANSVLAGPLRRSFSFVTRHPTLAVVPRTLLKPFPRLATDLYRVATQPHAPATNSVDDKKAPLEPAGDAGPLDDPIVARLPALARVTYLKLETALSKGGDSHQIP